MARTPKQITALTPADRDVLRQVVDDARHGGYVPPSSINQSNQFDHEEFPTPEVYIARTPEDGIPALNEEIIGTGSGTGTGTVYHDYPDQPGYADCDIYRLLTNNETGDDELIAVDGLTQRVYNFSTCAVPGSTWVLVIRDKFETWFVLDAPTCPTIPPTTTTTTTTTTTPPPTQCSGLCAWEWDNTDKLWDLITPGPGTGSGTGCIGSNCACLHPTFCGSFSGEVTYTPCVGGPGDWVGQVPCCGQTTTTSIPVLSTDPCGGFECCFQWFDVFAGWVKIIDCPNPAICSCHDPSTPGTNCSTATTPCEPPPPPPPPPSCGGTCKWGWIANSEFICFGDPSEGTGYWYGTDDCTTHLFGCRCESPSYEGTACATAYTGCYTPDPPPDAPDCVTTTTQCPTCCNLNCLWKGNGSGGWYLIGNQCGSSCTCNAPPAYASSSNSETAAIPCGTTTTTTSTTTTTQPPYQCWECQWFIGPTPTSAIFPSCANYDQTGNANEGTGEVLECNNPTGNFGSDTTCNSYSCSAPPAGCSQCSNTPNMWTVDLTGVFPALTACSSMSQVYTPQSTSPVGTVDFGCYWSDTISTHTVTVEVHSGNIVVVTLKPSCGTEYVYIGTLPSPGQCCMAVMCNYSYSTGGDCCGTHPLTITANPNCS